MELVVSADDDVKELFRHVARELQQAFGHSQVQAERLAKDYHDRFTDAGFCKSIGIPPQDDDFFFHEAAGGVALRAEYYLVIQGPSDPFEFIKWRTT
ncbi:hypothetical protein ACS5PN_21905 [Roseateles sp. NT4]|uniref:hypothetical protein n=1 Tax=Roseateles sp. NT4 TaxID=3453715 RepID=UPI003EEDEA4C